MKMKNTIKNIQNNIIKYIGIGIISGLTLINTTKAQNNTTQNNTKQHKPPTEIIQEGDNIIIPEHKLEEFMKNYKPKTNNTKKIQKTTLEEYIKDGYITDALTTQPIQGIETKLLLYDFITLIDTIGPVQTNSEGYYTFTITGIKDQKETKNIGTIKYNTINTPTIELNLKTPSKVQIKIYDQLGQEIKTLLNEETKQKTINININNLTNGIYILQTTINGKQYNNKILKTGQKYNYGKTQEQITETTTKTIEKTTEQLLIAREFQDPNNQYHTYSDSDVEPYAENISKDFTLIPRIQLENPITDPEYPIIPNINTIRDLLWYGGRVQGYWNYQQHGKTQYPIKIYIDSSNAPTGGITSARNIIQYFQDSLNIHPDSLIQETPINIEPNFNNGISAMKIIWTDSTQTYGYNSVLTYIYSSSHDVFIGGEIYIDTNKVTTTENIEKYIALNIQRYITGLVNPINNQNYLQYTTAGNRIGPTKRPNNDEKKLIKIGRNHKPYYTNRLGP
ncbi:MAG: hypothetical protein KatS3mg002_1431 [Candidatus Woesearchaeota archaeon]|nr:MAG: hypothetical protein KatS3mg002_1431 [Candidatus Woesearchaeota archaeon]